MKGITKRLLNDKSMEPKEQKEKTIFESIEVSPEISINVLKAMLETEVKFNEEKEEQITILTEQRNGFQSQLQEMRKLYDSSQEPKESFRIVRWRENPHCDVVCINLMEATKYVEEYNARAGKQECYVDEDIWHPLSYHETIKLEEQISILTSQRDDYKKELSDQRELFKASQEEVNRLKEELIVTKIQWEGDLGYWKERDTNQKNAIEKLMERVKELTELVKEAHSFVHEKRKDTPGMGYLLTILSKGINL